MSELNVASIPVELAELRQWVTWKREQRDGNETKVPYCCDGQRRASTTDPATWTTFDEALQAVSIGGLADGIGFVFTRDDPYCGFDLDEGLSESERSAIVEGLDSYTEASVSGSGLHVIVRASLNGHGRNRKGPFEVYERERYFVMTGAHLAGTPTTIEERQTQLEEIVERFLPVAPPATVGTREPVPIDLDDRELLERAFRAKNGAAIEALYRGDTSAHGDDDSAADGALCSHLAFWFGRDKARMDSVFRSSGLMRDKWDSPRGASTYGANTIAFAITGCADVYEPTRPRRGSGARIADGSRPDALAELLDTFGRWLHLPDPGALLAGLGAIAANRLDGDPVWLLLVGPPGGGKSELLTAVSSLPDVHPCATLTEAALLSGTPKKEHASDAKGGLLRTIGEFGIVVAKDFGSVLSMNRDARALVLAALREVYDGAWTRHVGTDGGRTMHWQGKVGLLGGCTPTIDRHHAVMGSMGERFVLYRLPPVDAREQARRAFNHAGHEKTMRSELAAAVANLFEHGLAEPRTADENEIDLLVTLSTFVVRCRSAVERDGYSREIELIPEAEAPTRLIVVLSRLLAGLDAIGVDRETAWRVVTKTALDSVPALRLAVLAELHETPLPTEAGTIGAALGYPQTTVKRALEDLAAHDLAIREPQGPGKANLWSLTPFARESLTAVRNPSRKVVVPARGEVKGLHDTALDPSSAPPDISEQVPDEEIERLSALAEELGL